MIGIVLGFEVEEEWRISVYSQSRRGKQPKELSRREQEVLRLLAQGHSNQQVADQIRVSVKTVETYRTRLREKLGLKERAELYRFAVESGLLNPDR